MSIPITPIHILRLLLQADQNLTQLQRDIRSNALQWAAMAQAQSPDVATIAGFMNSAATAYQTRLAWISTAQADVTNWNLLVTMWQKLGGVSGDFSSVVTPLQAVANQLGAADKSTYAAITSACNQITAAINAPLSLWPE